MAHDVKKRKISGKKKKKKLQLRYSKKTRTNTPWNHSGLHTLQYLHWDQLQWNFKKKHYTSVSNITQILHYQNLYFLSCLKMAIHKSQRWNAHFALFLEGKQGRFLKIIIHVTFAIAHSKVRQANGVYRHLVGDSSVLPRLTTGHQTQPFIFHFFSNLS